MSPAKPNKTAPSNPDNPIITTSEPKKIILEADIPFERGKAQLISGFLLSGIGKTEIFDIIRSLKLDSQLGSPTTTSYINDVIRKLRKNGLLDKNGLPHTKFASQAIFDSYKNTYLEYQKRIEQKTHKTEIGKPGESEYSESSGLETSSGTSENSDEKNLNNVGTPGQAKLDAANKFLEPQII